jgi:3-methyladenine DNA glycosylase/8-oxoguanine DNA glycosylase
VSSAGDKDRGQVEPGVAGRRGALAGGADDATAAPDRTEAAPDLTAAAPDRTEAGSGHPLDARFDAPAEIDLRLTLAPLRHGYGDATIRFARDGVWLARRTASGPATLRIWNDPPDRSIMAQAWGPGAGPALEAVPGLAGLLDDPARLVVPAGPIREIQRRMVGLRLPRTGQLLPALIPAVAEQKVTAGEAQHAYAALLKRLGETAPGPVPLVLPPTGRGLAALPYFEFHPMGLERRRAELLGRIGRLEPMLEALAAGPPADAFARLNAIPGIGPWTAAEACRVAFGDPDAVSVGDAHLPDLVAWVLAREPRADDARMLELLAPYEGQRARVVRLLEASGIRIPRFGPRFTPGRIERL